MNRFLCLLILPFILLPYFSGATLLCDSPELLTAGQISDSSAVLSWTDVADQYELELRPAEEPFTGVFTHLVSADPPFAVTGLLPGQVYHFRVRAVCGPGETGNWSVQRTFTTDLNNKRPCPLAIDLRDTTCNHPQLFRLHVDHAQGANLGNDLILQSVRIMIEHPWRSDLSVWLHSPDGTRVQLIGGLNAGDQNIGDPEGVLCPRFVELTDDTTAAQPLSAAKEIDNFTGLYLPDEALAPFNNGQAPNGIWQIEICDSKAAHTGKLRVFELVFAQTGCVPVSGVQVAGVDESGAVIDWEPDLFGDSLYLEYGPAGFHPGVDGSAGDGGTLITLAQPASSPVVLSGLQTLQWYEVYLRRRCGPGWWSPNSVALVFFTNCPATLLETVDTLAICPSGCPDPCPLPGLWQNVPDDDYEWKVRTGPGLTWPNAGPPGPPDGTGNYLFFRNSCSFSGAFGKKAKLRTLCVDVAAPAGAPCHFSFDLYMHAKVGQMGSLALQISTDGGQSWTSLRTWTGNQGKRWRREYIDLSAYDGQTALLQLVATGAYGAYGDIALDNLAFYGSVPAGSPDFIFYRDQDADGFGNPALPLIACNPALPPGYSLQPGDCNDTESGIHPGATEVLCNGIDENCNGMADDVFIATPFAPDTALCAGSDVVLTAQGLPSGAFFWYGSSDAAVPAGTGNTFLLNNLLQDTLVFLQDSMPAGCASPRYAVHITVHSRPDLLLSADQSVCAGAALDLAAVPITDLAGTNGVLSFYSGLPFSGATLLNDPLVYPPENTVYYAQSTTGFGCTGEVAIPVLVHALPTVQIVQGDTIKLCRGTIVNVQAMAAGNGPFQYSWSNGLNLPQIPVAAGGVPFFVQNLHVEVSDQNGCQSYDHIVAITQNNINQTAIGTIQHAGVCGGADGSITLTPLNGVGPYSFSWSGPVSGQLNGINGTGTITGLSQGGYRVTVTDAIAGCSMVLPQIIINAPGFAVTLDSVVQPVCPETATGCIGISASGQNPQISWSNGGSGWVQCNLPSGTYTATVSDGNCVQVLSGLSIEGPPPFNFNLNAMAASLCAGDVAGVLELAVFGATPPYVYSWSNGGAQALISGLPGGNYDCTVSDAAGCTATSPVYVLDEPAPLLTSVDLLTPADCYGGKNGMVIIAAAGGVPPYNYLWNNGTTGAAVGPVHAGQYTVTVTDANDCTTVRTVSIGEPPPVVLEVTAVSPTCIGTEDGALSATATGGTMPYQWQWSNGQNTPVLNGLGAGLFRLTLTDAQGCNTVSAWQPLTAVQLLDLTLDSVGHVDCFGNSTGFIGLSLSGAEGNVTFSWNGIPGGATAANLAAGPYTVLATDSRGCETVETYAVDQPTSALTLGVDAWADVLCFGEPNGGIWVSSSGGTPPYSYLWSNGTTAEDLPAVPAGHYALTVTDQKGCAATVGPIDLVQPPELEVAITINPIPCFGVQNGQIKTVVSGGSAPYQYFWSTGANTPNLFYLPAGDYSLTVTDATGCAKVFENLEITLLNDQFSVQPLEIIPVSCAGAEDGRIRVRLENGAAPYQYAWSPPIGLHANVPVPEDAANGLQGGIYRVTVTDAAGCFTVSQPFQVEEAPPLLLQIDSIQPVLCKGEATGFISASGSGGLPAYQWNWNPADTLPAVSELAAGYYYVTITDQQGCSVSAGPVLLTEPAVALKINTVSVDDDDCGLLQGAIDISPGGGTFPYQYAWSNGAGTQDILQLAGGEYQLTLTDENGCSAVSPLYQVNGNDNPMALVLLEIEPEVCFADSSGSISLAVEGGDAPYFWSWNISRTTPQVDHLPAGNYFVTVSDAAGCTLAGAYTVGGPQEQLGSAWTSSWTGQDWTVNLLVFGGTTPYQVNWDAAAGNQTGLIATGLTDGIYGVTVTDANNCVFVFHVALQSSGTAGPAPLPEYRVWPNPVSGFTGLYWMNAVAEVRLLHPTGGVLQHWHPAKDVRQLEIDLQMQAAGVYILEVFDTQGRRTGILVQKL